VTLTEVAIQTSHAFTETASMVYCVTEIITVNIIIIIIIIIFVITCMQGIYTYIPETNNVSRVYSVAAVLYLHFVLHVMLFHPQNMFCTFT
jgi:hypothetical protein